MFKTAFKRGLIIALSVVLIACIGGIAALDLPVILLLILLVVVLGLVSYVAHHHHEEK